MKFLKTRYVIPASSLVLLTSIGFISFKTYEKSNSKSKSCLTLTGSYEESLRFQQEGNPDHVLELQKNFIIQEVSADQTRLARITLKDSQEPDRIFYATLQENRPSLRYYSDSAAAGDNVSVIFGSFIKVPAWSLSSPFEEKDQRMEDLNGVYLQDSSFQDGQLQLKKTSYLADDDLPVNMDVVSSRYLISYKKTPENTYILSDGQGEELFKVRTQKVPTSLRTSLRLTTTHSSLENCENVDSDEYMQSNGLQELTLTGFRKVLLEKIQKDVEEQRKPVAPEVFQAGVDELFDFAQRKQLTDSESSRRNALIDQTTQNLKKRPDDAALLRPGIEKALKGNNSEYVHMMSDILGEVGKGAAVTELENLIKQLEREKPEDFIRAIMSTQFIDEPQESTIRLLESYYNRDQDWTKAKEVSILALATLQGRAQDSTRSAFTENLQKGLDARETQKTRILNLEALNNVRDPATIPQFKALVQDKDAEIATRAVNALGHFNGDEVHDYLLTLALDGKTSPEVRGQAWMSIGSRQMTQQAWTRLIQNYLEYRSVQKDKNLLQPYLNTILGSPMRRAQPESLKVLQETKNLYDWEREMLDRE
jgi:hypothetical protein